MKILVLGSKGQLGQCLNDQLSHTDHKVFYTSRVQIDIEDFDCSNVGANSVLLTVNDAAGNYRTVFY
mgnify:CR=1 FL=1